LAAAPDATSVKCDILNQLYFQKSVFRIAESVLNNKDVKQTMREVLNKMSIKVEDKRGNSKNSKKKVSKPIKLTEDSHEYKG